MLLIIFDMRVYFINPHFIWTAHKAEMPLAIIQITWSIENTKNDSSENLTLMRCFRFSKSERASFLILCLSWRAARTACILSSDEPSCALKINTPLLRHRYCIEYSNSIVEYMWQFNFGQMRSSVWKILRQIEWGASKTHIWMGPLSQAIVICILMRLCQFKLIWKFTSWKQIWEALMVLLLLILQGQISLCNVLFIHDHETHSSNIPANITRKDSIQYDKIKWNSET